MRAKAFSTSYQTNRIILKTLKRISASLPPTPYQTIPSSRTAGGTIAFVRKGANVTTSWNLVFSHVLRKATIDKGVQEKHFRGPCTLVAASKNGQAAVFSVEVSKDEILICAFQEEPLVFFPINVVLADFGKPEDDLARLNTRTRFLHYLKTKPSDWNGTMKPLLAGCRVV